MTSPSLALRGAVIARLKADGDVTALIGTRIYDRIPPAATLPYLEWGGNQVINDGTDCHDDVEVFTTLHVWSRAVGSVEAERIAHAIARSLDAAEFDLTDNALILIEHRDTNFMTDPDGLTSHGVLVFRSLIQSEADETADFSQAGNGQYVPLLLEDI